MENIKKYGLLGLQKTEEGDLALINRQSLRALGAQEVFTFKLAACDNMVDRDNERFTDAALATLAERFVGKTVLCDHQWSAKVQQARVYAGAVETAADGSSNRLILRCYALRNEQTQPFIDAVEGGIMRECSVGCAVSSCTCSICGADMAKKPCGHRPGKRYGGADCHVELDDVQDAYEVSFVAVPAQAAAGVVKSYGGLPPEALPPEPGEPAPEALPPEPGAENPQEAEREKALALLGLELARY